MYSSYVVTCQSVIGIVINTSLSSMMRVPIPICCSVARLVASSSSIIFYSVILRFLKSILLFSGHLRIHHAYGKTLARTAANFNDRIFTTSPPTSQRQGLSYKPGIYLFHQATIFAGKFILDEVESVNRENQAASICFI